MIIQDAITQPIVVEAQNVDVRIVSFQQWRAPADQFVTDALSFDEPPFESVSDLISDRPLRRA